MGVGLVFEACLLGNAAVVLEWLDRGGEASPTYDDGPWVTTRRPQLQHRRAWSGVRGMTLLEIMVVIAIIAVLVSLVLYVTGAVQKTSRGMTCLSNQRQIMIGWDGYATDNAGRYVAPDTNRHAWDWVRSVGSNLGPGNTERESALTEGTMWKYHGDLRLYRSPLSESDNIRTYSLSAFFSDGEGSDYWGGPPSWQIATRSRIPKPSETIA